MEGFQSLSLITYHPREENPSKRKSNLNNSNMQSDSRITQKRLIFEHLKRYGSIEPMTALREYGCYRLSSRISELRTEGINIRTDYIMQRSKVTGFFVKFAKYTLNKD